MKVYCMLAMATLAVVACSSDDEGVQDTPMPAPADTTAVERKTVALLARAEDPRTDGGLQAGLFMVSHAGGGSSELLPAGNYADNVVLTCADGQWVPAAPLLWPDETAAADFIGYAPRQATVADARQLPFHVETDQRTAAAQAASDLLYGAVLGQTPQMGAFDLVLRHQLSRLTVVVSPGNGFDDGELHADDLQVAIGGTRTTATLNLADGNITPTGTAQVVQCMEQADGGYSAILIPQTVPFSNFIQVDWRGSLYTLQRSFTLEPGRQYTITISLNKSKGGLDIGISGWDITSEDFGGTVG